jgi:hypothetical protein
VASFQRVERASHGGELALLETEINILIGAQILREYLNRFRDSRPRCRCTPGRSTSPLRSTLKVFAEKARPDALRQKAKKQQSA